MLLDYKGREAGQSSTFTICRQKKKEENRWAREKKQNSNTHMNAHLLINTLKKNPDTSIPLKKETWP